MLYYNKLATSLETCFTCANVNVPSTVFSLLQLTVGYINIAEVAMKSLLRCLDVFIELHCEAVLVTPKKSVQVATYNNSNLPPWCSAASVPVILPTETRSGEFLFRPSEGGLPEIIWWSYKLFLLTLKLFILYLCMYI